MRRARVLAMLALAWSLTAGAAETLLAGLDAIPPTEAGHALALVTFTDRSLQRAPVGRPGEIYVPSADYASSVWGRRMGERIARDHALRKVTEWPVLTLGVHCVVYAIDDARALSAVVDELEGDRRVTRVYPMNTFRTMTHVKATNDPYLPLQKSVAELNLDVAHRYATGRGVTVAVVDTGVDGGHVDLDGQVAQSRDLITDTRQLSAVEGHGTAVAGVIAARADNHEGIVGVAPAARLVSLRACWASTADGVDGQCNTLTLAKALDNAIRMHARIINMSLSGPRDELLEALAATALAAGATIVGAMPEDVAAEDAFPTSVPGVIRVNAEGLARPAGPTIDAPGTEIFTTLPHDTYGFMSGSSIAAAHVSGVLALLLEKAPELDTAALRDILLETHRPDGHETADLSGLDACAALAHVDAGVECPALTPTAADDGAAGTAVPRPRRS